MQDKVSISIIIVNYNGRHHLDECFEALGRQTFTDFETIVVDNGSTDGSLEHMASNYPHVRCIPLGYNSGFCVANNRGIEQAGGKYIVLLNNDTQVADDWLEKLHKALDSDTSAGFAASMMLSYYNRDEIDSAGDGYAVSGAAYKIGNHSSFSTHHPDKYVFGACAGAAMYKRSMIDQIGFLDEDFFLLFEDADLNFRAQLAGYKCILAHDAIVYHKVHSTFGKINDMFAFHAQRNVEYAYFKNMPARLILLTILPHVLYNVLGFGYYIMKGCGWAFIRAKFAFLMNFGKIIVKRRQIQRNKAVSDKYIWQMLQKNWLSGKMKAKAAGSKR